MPRTRDEVIGWLIARHFDVEGGLERIAVVRGGPNGPIKLLEVNANTVPSGSIEVFSFSPTADVPFVTEIAELTPEEWQRLERNALETPLGWSRDDIEQVFDRPAAA
jgi:hypothetical protein